MAGKTEREIIEIVAEVLAGVVPLIEEEVKKSPTPIDDVVLGIVKVAAHVLMLRFGGGDK